MPKYMVSETTLVTAKLRLAKKRMGSIGSAARNSQATNALSSRAADQHAQDDGTGPTQRLDVVRTRP